jgi:uncharacterized cupredoxin-like copper-binding protein
MTTEDPAPADGQRDEDREAQDRVLLPILIPAIAFLFAVLVIYGLSRIYLEFDTYSVGDVSMATPMAIGVMLLILGACAWLAVARRVTIAAIGAIVLASVGLLTIGGVWAAVHEESSTHEEPPQATGEAPEGTPAAPGTTAVGLIDPDWAVTASPDTTAAGTITFTVTNEGTITHNFRIVAGDIPDALPIDDSGFQVDEAVVEVLAESADLDVGETEEVPADLATGAYVIFCNIAQHYENGMFTAFTVE